MSASSYRSSRRCSPKASRRRSAPPTFASYALIGSLVAALGALPPALPELLHDRLDVSLARPRCRRCSRSTRRSACCTYLLYRRLPPDPQRHEATRVERARRRRGGSSSRSPRSSASMPSAAASIVQSLLALWLFRALRPLARGRGRDLLLDRAPHRAVVSRAAVRIARRIGLVNTMVFTHLPANLCMIALPFAPSLPHRGRAAAHPRRAVADGRADAQLVRDGRRDAARARGRGEHHRRCRAASPRPWHRCSRGWLFALSPFGWPLLAAGGLKAIYDVLLLLLFQRHKPPEEVD